MLNIVLSIRNLNKNKILFFLILGCSLVYEGYFIGWKL